MVGDATGITNAWNCIQNPSWGQCLEAAGKLLLTASAIATDGGTLELEGSLEAAAEDTSGATTQIFRNVDAREFESITSTGRFSTAEGQMEGKWFATQGEHAEQWGQLQNRGEGITVETRIPQSVADQLYLAPGKLDGIGPAFYANSEQLDLINQSMDGIRMWP